jgi:hypothetical protein
MIRLARVHVAAPGKTFELIAALKEAAGVVKVVTGLELTNFISMGAQVGETVSVMNFSSMEMFEEASVRLLTSKDWQARTRKFEGLVVPGLSRDQLLRQI